VKRVEKYIGGREFMLTYGDGVCDVDIGHLLEFHRRHGKVGTVTGVRPPSRFGELVVKDRRVAEFSEKPQIRQGYINGGFFVFKKDFFKYLPTADDLILEKKPLENLARDRELMVYEHDGFWQCMDTYRDYKLLNDLWSAGQTPWMGKHHGAK
jgi:glucose-1-phosphate cytidylyltransferase